MKSLLQILICCMMFISLHAQKYHSDNNNTEWMTFKTAEQTSATQLAQNKTVLQLQDKDNLNPIVKQSDQLGGHHYRYQQTYDGIPVEGAIYILHEKNNRVKTANGKLVHQLKLNTMPSISVDAALTFALAHIDAELYAWDDPMHENGIKEVKNQPDATFYPSGKLVIIDPEFKQQATNCKLAYKFDIYAVQPYTRQEVFVDAHNGSIITTLEKIHNCNDVLATGTSNYHGTVGFTACHENGTYTLKNNIGGGMQVYYDNYEGDGTDYSEFPFTSNSAFFQNMPEAVDVHSATEATYNYFLNTHGRNSLDDEGMLLKSWVHHGDNLNNAGWTGWCMFYGDGDGNEHSSWTTNDIVAHEMAHGVTEYSANLIYQGESGALNESFSDIFAEMVDNQNDWLIGKELILTPGISGLRSMSNPKDPNAKYRQPDTYGGQYWHTDTRDYGGVHTNSGVQNYWFYLLSEGGSGTNDNGYNYDIIGIGKDKAAAIAYLNLTEYLTSNANYTDARAGAIQAATDLYGLGSNEAIQTEEAWCAVGVGCGPITPCIANDSLALVALYNSTNGPNWTNTWNLNQPMDTWHGVTLNENRCVKRLDISDNNLIGSISHQIGNLSNLTNLSLPNNQLTDTIPHQIGNLSNLTNLNLANNKLSGSIPTEIGNLDTLIYLDISMNQLIGTIPHQIGNLSNLTNLNLADNKLSGSIPTEIGNLDNLIYLDISMNQLIGNIPGTLGYPFSHGNVIYLTHLNLANNQLSGSIPFQVENLSNLTDLNLSNNKLTGNIPSEIGNLNNLTDLNLAKNKLTGKIPPEIGNLNNLIFLDISNNQLEGCYDISFSSLCDSNLSNSNISEGNNLDDSWDNFCSISAGICQPITGIDPCVQNDSLALIALYNTTNGTNWINKWNLNDPMSTWYGLALNQLGCVRYLNLRSNNLDGTIPPEIGNLNDLRYLDLSGNQLIGDIPPEIGNLNNLTHLDIVFNQLSGSIPPEIGNLNNLTHLFLYRNIISGSIPPEIGNLSNLTHLNMDFNQLSGSIPPEIGNLSNLNDLNLSENHQLSGSIPPEIGNLSNLIHLLIHNTNLTGDIPSEIGNLNYLISLWLHDTQLSGNIPPEIGNLSNLRFLYLWNNQLNGNIPPEIGNLSNLKHLHLYDNHLSGSIPSEIGNLSNLRFLYLWNNQLNGNIPPEIGNLSNLKHLHLYGNHLSGSIPSEIGNLSNLIHLILNNNNHLSGSIPPEIGNLSNLTHLYLAFNKLTGNIPSEIGNLSNLIHLILENNNLNGTIPPETGNLSNLTHLYLAFNKLTGNIPSEIGNLSNVIDLNLSHNELYGTIPPETGNLNNLVILPLNDNQLSGNIPPEIGNLDNLTGLHLQNNQLSGCYNPNLSNLCGQLTNYNISIDNNFDATWDDFCNTQVGRCPITPVLPGDFNNDGTANQDDILYWGLAEGYSGAARPNATTDWVPQECLEWDGYINGVNLHHTDANGNGTVDNNDLSVLELNFGQTTQNFSVSSQSPSSSIFLMSELSNEPWGSNRKITYELYLQSNTPISTHGISGSIDLSNIPGIISVSIDTTGSVLQPDAYIDVYDSNQKIANIGLTKISKNNELIDGTIGSLFVIVPDDFQIGDPLELRTNGGSMISSNGVVTPIAASTLYAVPNSATPDLPVSLSLNHAYCSLGGTATTHIWEGTEPYTYTWSTGDNTASVSNLPIGTHSLTVTDANNLEKVIDFEIEWAFTPVEVYVGNGLIYINFEDAPLDEAIQVSLDGGTTYKSPITITTPYIVTTGTYHILIRQVTDTCSIDLGTVTVSSGGGCSSRVADKKLMAIGGKFGQFANDEFIKNFLTAEKAYIRYQAEIHRILESKEARYTKINEDFDKIKDRAMAMLFQSFISKRPVTVTNEHIKAIDNFLVSLSQATNKDKLRDEIAKVRRHLHVMAHKEVKDALIAFDRAGATHTSEITPFDTPDKDEFDVQLLNTAGRESRVTYNLTRQGTLNMSLYNTNGQQLMTLHNGISYEGRHQIPIDKSSLPSGIYFIHIEYISDNGILINKILKLPVTR